MENKDEKEDSESARPSKRARGEGSIAFVPPAVQAIALDTTEAYNVCRIYIILSL